MKLTPIDIAQKTFNKKMVGNDPEEVSAFLSQIATQFEAMIHERAQLRESLRERDLLLLDFKEREKILKETINTASHMAEKMRQDAEREAKLILADAQQKSEIITRDSRDSLKKMYQEVTDLKRMRLQFEANLKALAQAHLSLIEQGEKYMPQMQLPHLQFESQTQDSRSQSTAVSPLSANP